MARMTTPSSARMRAERDARGWSQRETIRRLRAQTVEQLPAEESLLRSWKKWEAGDHQPDDFYKPLIAKMFGTVTAALFPEPTPKSVDTALLAANGMTTLEILNRIRMSSIDNATLDSLRITADQLSCEYPYMPSDQLRIEGQQWLRRITNLLNRNLTLAQHEEVLSLAGMIALLVGCVENDMGDRRAAEATRRSALSLGTEARDTRVMGWAHEMSAWFSLTDGDYRGVLAAADAGIGAAGRSDVSVQLLAQKAKAYARMGNERQLESTLETGRDLLETLPYPEDVSHHFVVDPDKWDFYVMDCYRISGQNELARTYAEGVIRSGTDVAGNERAPMRNAEARITLGVVAARQGDLEHAVHLGERAISGGRQSMPSLLMVSAELEAELTRNFPREPDTADYTDHLRVLRTASVL
jgi:hypothetical protein